MAYLSVLFFAAILIACALAAPDDKPTCMNQTNSNQSYEALKSSMRLAVDDLSRASTEFAVNGSIELLINTNSPNKGLALSALKSCRQLVSLATYNLNKSLSSDIRNVEERGNVMSWLCAAGVNLHICVEGFDEDRYNGVTLRKAVYEKLESPIYLTENSSRIISLLDNCATNTTTVLLGQEEYSSDPHWLSSEDRRILDSSDVAANVVVAQDGSGKYRKVSDAVKAAPRSSNNRFVIYVKKGTYYENVIVDYDQWNVMIYGDGMDLTIISSNLSYGTGQSTADSATFTANGQGFIARDIGFVNTAGAINKQAVALQSNADKSVFYRCRMDGYQDTLYAHSNRHFYRECRIYGTIDFIFGGASAVVQKSSLYVRKPLQGQQNAIATQYRKTPQCPTGIVIQSSTIQQAEDLTGVKSYLGRPWTAYATVVFMQNVIGKFINPEGWMPWNNEPPPNTIYFAEYGNTGDGAGIAGRVRWVGVRSNISAQEAGKFTVRSFIGGDQWIPMANIAYDPGL